MSEALRAFLCRVKDSGTGAFAFGIKSEHYIGQLIALQHPEFKVMLNKSTWQNEGSDTKIHFDFLTSSQEDGKPDGILEIKTARHASGWGDSSEGLDGIAPMYRAQVLAQCYESGVENGRLGVLINGHELRLYEFKMNDELRAEAKRNEETMNRFIGEMRQKIEENGGKKFNKNDPEDRKRLDAAVKSVRVPTYYGKRSEWTPSEAGIPKKVLSGGMETKMGYIESVAALRNEPKEKVAAEYAKMYPGEVSTWSDDQKQQAFSSLLSNGDYSNSRVTGVNYSTNEFNPSDSRVVEWGMSSVNVGDNSSTGQDFHQFYSPGEKAMDRRGKSVGNSGFHKVQKDDIQGQPEFNSDEVQSRILDTLEENGAVATQDQAQLSMLRRSVKGFARAEYEGRIRNVNLETISRISNPETKFHKISNLASSVGEDGRRFRNRRSNDVAKLATDSLRGIARKFRSS